LNSSAGRTVFIVNPRSSSGRTARRFEALQPLIATLFPNAGLWHTKERGHATLLAQQALDEGAITVVAVGGDGTLNEVLNGFFEQGRLRKSDAALAVLMSGTGGDFRRSIGWPGDLHDELLRIQQGRRTLVDVGLVQSTSTNGEMQKRYFLNCASVGLTALAAAKVQASPKRKNRWAYFFAGLRALKEFPGETLEATLDDEFFLLQDLSFLTFANAVYFAGGVKVAPQADLSDGYADVCALSHLTLSYALIHAYRAYLGTHLSLKRVRHMRAKKIALQSQGQTPVLVEVDGEPCGRLPARFEICKQALPLIW
jgi:YegS/Rv2252/BmrU family lipid kinase